MQAAPNATRQENERHFELPRTVREIRPRSRQPPAHPETADSPPSLPVRMQEPCSEATLGAGDAPAEPRDDCERR